MKTMDELLSKLKSEGYKTAEIELQLIDYRRNREKIRRMPRAYPAYMMDIHYEAIAFQFLAGCLYTLSSIGYISDDERKAIIENLEKEGRS